MKDPLAYMPGTPVFSQVWGTSYFPPAATPTSIRHYKRDGSDHNGETEATIHGIVMILLLLCATTALFLHARVQGAVFWRASLQGLMSFIALSGLGFGILVASSEGLWLQSLWHIVGGMAIVLILLIQSTLDMIRYYRLNRTKERTLDTRWQLVVGLVVVILFGTLNAILGAYLAVRDDLNTPVFIWFCVGALILGVLMWIIILALVIVRYHRKRKTEKRSRAFMAASGVETPTPYETTIGNGASGGTQGQGSYGIPTGPESTGGRPNTLFDGANDSISSSRKASTLRMSEVESASTRQPHGGNLSEMELTDMVKRRAIQSSSPPPYSYDNSREPTTPERAAVSSPWL